MKYDKITIGNRIKNACKNYKTENNKKLTQDGLAEMLHISRETVNSWANGRVLPSLDDLFKMCEIFECDLGHLLGEYEEKTRIAADIHSETGLSESAIQKLRSLDKTSDNDLSLSPAVNVAQDKLDLRQYTQPDLFIPQLISYMITSKSFEGLINRICTQNKALWEYSTLHDVEKEIITHAYNIALRRVGAAADNIQLLQSEYCKVLREYMIKNCDDIQNKHPVKFAPGAFETIYADKLCSLFHLARMASEQTEEMIAFLNSKDFFNIVGEFMEPISKYK